MIHVQLQHYLLELLSSFLIIFQTHSYTIYEQEFLNRYYKDVLNKKTILEYLLDLIDLIYNNLYEFLDLNHHRN